MDVLVLNWLDRENPQAGGAEVHLHEVYGRLARRGHRVTLICSGFEGARPRTELDGIEVHRTGGRHTLGFAAPRYYRERFVDHRFDAVVEDLNKVPFFSPWWVREPVGLLVHHLFGGIAFQEASPPIALATWLLERPIPRVYGSLPCVAVSESTAEDLRARGMRRGRITVIPNGVDTAHYSPGSGDRFPEPTLLFLGRLKRYKRVDLVIRTVAELRDRGLDVKLRIGGKGDHRPALEKLVRALGVQDRVVFEGFVDEERKVELFRRSWVHLLTSPKEGWGIANLEAAACGTATVASNSPGLRDSVVDGTTGYLVPHGDVTALADRVRLLVVDPDLRERMGRAAREFARIFAYDRVADATEEWIRERVVGPTRASAGSRD